MRLISIIVVGLILTGLSKQSFGQSKTEVSKGARIWSMTCDNCHNARSPAERTDRQWAVIVNHMRTRAHLTKSEARAVKAFLQRSNASGERKQGAKENPSNEAPRDTLPKSEVRGDQTLPPEKPDTGG